MDNFYAWQEVYSKLIFSLMQSRDKHHLWVLKLLAKLHQRSHPTVLIGIARDQVCVRQGISAPKINETNVHTVDKRDMIVFLTLGKKNHEAY